MYRIGLTGGIATGKSTVVAMLQELGAVVIDADQLARQVVQPGEPAYREIVSWLGEEILLPDGQLNRQSLARIIFDDVEARGQLNSITHPRVIARMELMADVSAGQGYVLPLVFDIPLLIESNLQYLVDEIWLVAADESTQLSRLISRDQLSRTAALARMRAQLPFAAKVKWSTEVIDNNGSLEQTRLQVQLAWQAAIRRSQYSTHEGVSR